MSPAFLLVLPAYLLGTLASAALVANRSGHDPTVEGSGNPGASNVYRVAGWRAGAVVAGIDIAKGAVPTLIGLLLSGRPVAAACWCAAVVGHIFPISRRFRGGKGVATAGGGALVLYPLLSLGLVVVFFVVARLFGKASLGSLAISAGLIIGVVAIGSPAWEIAVAIAVVVLVVVRHRANIVRLLAGGEQPYRT